jgi:dTDP-4-amino-4,6-dideoxygalactose transaminase
MIKCHNLERRFNQVKAQYWEFMHDIVKRETVNNGYYTSNVEQWLTNRSGRKYALLTNNGSNALLLSMMVYDIGPGDEVIITNYSCPASESYVKTVGAIAVYCDVDETGNMDAVHLESLLSAKTKAVVATGLYGDMHNHASIQAFTDANGLYYINDAAQSMFSSRDGVSSLSTGDIVCMSFAENKNLPCFGTHGALLVDSNELFYKLTHLRKHGKPFRTAPYTARGINGVPEEDNAAQIWASTKFVDKWQARRHEIAHYYDKEFAKRGVEVRPHHPEWNTHKYAIMFWDKFEAQKALKAQGVDSEAHYPNAFSSLPRSYRFVKQALSIPMNAHLTDAEVEIVVKKVEKVWKSKTI